MTFLHFIVAFIFIIEITVSAEQKSVTTIFHHEFQFRQYFQRQRIPLEAAAVSACSEEAFFTQIVDHFNNTNQKTWKQRYQINDKYFNSAETDKPAIFLLIGGEEVIDDQNICYEKFPLLKMAKTHNALIIQLEHRFFGKSYPITNGSTIGDMSVEALQLLTPQQALEDLANFIKTFKYKNIEWKNPKWILFGGSYPGTLCAWSRAFYTDISVGGICSSAPLWVKLDFSEYANVMEYAISNYSAVKYPYCSNSIKNGFNQLTELISTTDGRNQLNNIFNISPNLTPTARNDVESNAFLNILFGLFQHIIQYNVVNSNYVSGYNIDKLCKKFQSGDGPVNAIRDIYFETASAANDNSQIFPINYERDVKILSQTLYDFSNPISQQNSLIRGWRWLLCGAGLGWMQSAENKNGMFGNVLSLNFSLAACTDIFTSMNIDFVQKKVLQTSEHFSLPSNYTAKNVVLTNGDYDPWSALRSDVNNETRHQFSKISHGSSHCSDMLPTIPGDSADLLNLRDFVEKEVSYYLDSPLPTKSSSTRLFLSPLICFFILLSLIFIE